MKGILLGSAHMQSSVLRVPVLSVGVDRPESPDETNGGRKAQNKPVKSAARTDMHSSKVFGGHLLIFSFMVGGGIQPPYQTWLSFRSVYLNDQTTIVNLPNTTWNSTALSTPLSLFRWAVHSH
jgi:hypothetical protein